MNCIEKLYFAIAEEMKHSDGYEEVNREFDKVYEKILKLIPEETEILNELFIQTGGLESEFGRMYFKEGFKLAFALAAESFTACS